MNVLGGVEPNEGRRKMKDGRKKPTIVHHTARLLSDTHVPRLLLEFANCAFLNRLPCIDQTRGDLNDHLIDGRTVLLLQEELWTGRMIQDGHDANAIDLTVGGPGLPREGRSVCGHNRITYGLELFVCLIQQGGRGGGGLVLL